MSSDINAPGPSEEPRLQDQPWYHGKITRIHSESVLKEDGEFLIRDSISSPGEYVLTARWKRKNLHFQVNVTLDKGRKNYHFEDEYFSSVVNLINFYITHKRVITLASGCQIASPAPRTPVDTATATAKELEAAYMHIFRPNSISSSGSHISLSQQAMRNKARQNTTRPVSTLQQQRSIPPLSQALTSRPLPVPIVSPKVDDGEDYCDIDYDAMEDVLDASHSLKGRTGSVQSLYMPNLSRQFQSCVNLRAASPSPSIKTNTSTLTRPPLPPRPRELSDKLHAFSTHNIHKSVVDSDYDDIKKVEVVEENKDLKEDGLSSVSDYDLLSSDRSSTPRQRDSGVYSSPSPPNEVAVYSQLQMNQLKMFVQNKKPLDIAEFITYDDAKMLKFLGLSEKSGVGVNNGLRQLLLPSGQPLRQNLISRCRHLQLAIQMSIVSCNRSEAPKILRQLILTASVLLSKQLNVFGFANVVLAIEAKTIQNLNWLWRSLDLQSKSEWDSHLKFYRGLRHDVTQMTSSIPFIQPLLEIFSGHGHLFTDCSSYANEIDSLWCWLDGARKWLDDADNIRDIARGRLITSRCVEGPISNSQLNRLFLSNNGHLDEDKISQINDVIHKFACDMM